MNEKIIALTEVVEAFAPKSLAEIEEFRIKMVGKKGEMTALMEEVKTVAPGHYPEYDATVAFYRGVGFLPLEVFPTLWDENNPCLILVKTL